MGARTNTKVEGHNKMIAKAKNEISEKINLTIRAVKDMVRLAENAALVITSAYAFHSAYNREFAYEFIRPVIMGAAIVVSMIAADVFLNRYRDTKKK